MGHRALYWYSCLESFISFVRCFYKHGCKFGKHFFKFFSNSNRPFWPLCPVVYNINMYQHGKQLSVVIQNLHDVKMYIIIIKESDTYFDNHNNDGEIAYTATMATVKTHSLIRIYIQNTISLF